MELGAFLSGSDRFFEAVDQFSVLENCGLDAVWFNEGTGFDAPSRLAYLAAKTERLRVGSNVISIYTRTPTLLAMTAAGLDFVSGGRLNLGVGAGGQVILEGWHGTTFDDSVGRMRETIEICRKVWARDVPLAHHGRHYRVPIQRGRGESITRTWTLQEEPIRRRIPMWQAALGERSVALAAEIADGWLPLMLVPERIREGWGDALSVGFGRRDPRLGPLQIAAGGLLAIGEGERVVRLRDMLRPELAFRIGGIGPRGANPYNHLVRRYGFEEQAAKIEDLYFSGLLDEAAAAVPSELLELVSLIGPRGWLAERLAAFKEAGVTQLLVSPLREHADRLADHRQSWNWDVSTGTDAAVDLIGQVRDLL